MPEHAPIGPAGEKGHSQPLPPATERVALPLLLGMVTAVQAFATFTVLALPTLATKAAPSFGLGPEAVGYQISVIYVSAALLSSVAGLVVKRVGAARVSLWALLLCALSLAGIASGNLALSVLASLLVGAGYGLTNPAASHLLLKYAPPRHQNLIFALKQTGVPLGAMLAALLLPALAERFGWQAALWTSAAMLVLSAVPLWLTRRRLDQDRDPAARLGGSLLLGIGVVTASPALMSLAMMGLTYASFQFCLLTFVVTMLVSEFGWSLISAGAMATTMQVGGACGRIAWSVLADRIGSGRYILAGIGIASAVSALIVAASTEAWPYLLTGLVLFAFGFCLVGWNGLWMGEIARTSRPGEASLATGGVLVFTYIGVMFGPAAFALTYKWIGSYALTFGAFASLPLLGAVMLLAAVRTEKKASAAP